MQCGWAGLAGPCASCQGCCALRAAGTAPAAGLGLGLCLGTGPEEAPGDNKCQVHPEGRRCCCRGAGVQAGHSGKQLTSGFGKSHGCCLMLEGDLVFEEQTESYRQRGADKCLPVIPH